MKRNEIKIGRLEIRLNGGDRNSAKAVGASIGEEVLKQIGQQLTVARSGRTIRIAQVDAGKLRLNGDPRTSGSATAIAGQIAARISSKVGPVSSRGKR